jgi:hypothetical protein
VAETVVVRGDGFDIVAESGTVMFSHDWPDEIPAAVAELTEIFGSEPVVTETSTGNTHFPDYREYSWPGFQLDDAISLQRPRDEYFRSSGVYVTVADVNGIEVVTAQGLAVGSTYDDAAAVSIDQRSDGGRTGFLLQDDDLGSLALSGEDATELIARLAAPVAWGL